MFNVGVFPIPDPHFTDPVFLTPYSYPSFYEKEGLI